MTLSELKDLFTVKDYINLTGRCPRLAYEDVKQPGFPSIRVGKNIYIVKKDFLRWLDEKQKEEKAF